MGLFKTVILVLVVAIFLNFYIYNGSIDPYLKHSIGQMVAKHGYPMETHHIVTDDGYILTMHRIPRGRKQRKTWPLGIPVLLMHGVFQSSYDYIYAGPDKALGLLLADKGYDVWLGNVRGTTLSRRHVNLDPDSSAEYWNFSFEEMARYDIPSKIDYILQQTEHEALHYVGFSQGNTIVCVMATERPEYLRKIRLISALAPVLNSHVKPKFLTFASKSVGVMQVIFNTFGINEIFSTNTLYTIYFRHVCQNLNSVFLRLCLMPLELPGGPFTNMNISLLLSTFSLNPTGSSTKQSVHFLQIAELGSLSKFDYGAKKNIEIYGQESPTIYNLSLVNVSTAIYYSDDDWLTPPENIERVLKELPNVTKAYKIPIEHFNHLDFLYGKDVHELLYKSVIDEILKY